MRTRPHPLSLLVVAFVLAAGSGCGSEDADDAGAGTPGSSSSAAGAGASGASGAGGSSAGAGGAGAGPIGGDRPVEVFVPSSYDPGTPVPLVLLLHGYTATGALQEAYFQIEPQAEARGFLYAHPDGTQESGGSQFWNATDACCDLYGSDVDDSAYLAQVIEDIKAAYSVDAKRVYVMGHSNGGFMSYRMACDHADVIAGIASLAGAMFGDPADCKASEPVNVLQIHGDVDDTILYEGGSIVGNAYPSAATTVADWVSIDGCDATGTAGAPLDLATRADFQDSGSAELPGTETEVVVHGAGCKPGGHVELWTIAGGSHVPGLSPGFAPAVIDFLMAHPKP
ncbi:MAG: alpha/beta fold hydrolase [Polyangiaceae bacterium]